MPAAPSIDLPSLTGSLWLAEDIDGKGIMDNLQSKLRIVSTEQVAGSGGCNSFTGKATIEGDRFSFGPRATTGKMCPPAVMDQEMRFLDALGRVRSAMTQHGLLYLLDESGAQILRFSRTN